jgi:hypothetical protein
MLEPNSDFKKLFYHTAYELIKARLAGGDDAQARHWWDEWEREGGICRTFQRLVMQADAAPEEQRCLAPVEQVIVHAILTELFSAL